MHQRVFVSGWLFSITCVTLPASQRRKRHCYEVKAPLGLNILAPTGLTFRSRMASASGGAGEQPKLQQLTCYINTNYHLGENTWTHIRFFAKEH